MYILWENCIIYFLAFVLSIPVIYFKTDIPGDIWMYGETIIEDGFTKARVEYAYDKLPQPLQDMLEENGYRIYVVETIDDNEQILGQTIYGIRLILIKDYGVWIEKTFYHECGHVLDKFYISTIRMSSTTIIVTNPFRLIFIMTFAILSSNCSITSIFSTQHYIPLIIINYTYYFLDHKK